MKVGYHPAVQKDVNRIPRRYDKVSSRLGDEFWEELRNHVTAAAENPLRFHPFIPDLRRANLKRFPYHFLYRILSDRTGLSPFATTNRIPDSVSTAGRMSVVGPCA